MENNELTKELERTSKLFCEVYFVVDDHNKKLIDMAIKEGAKVAIKLHKKE